MPKPIEDAPSSTAETSPRSKNESCPIPKTHRRLTEAHLLWHQTLDMYHDPTAFGANLNATIEALRNVTFVLQNEKSAFPDFEAWYGPWQTRLKADATAKWLHDARTTVVHQGELESSSSAEVRLVTWRDEVIAKLDVPVGTPSSVILQDHQIAQSLDKYRRESNDFQDAAITIERRWSTPDLGGLELLEALARAYGLLSDMVVDAHVHLKQLGCIPSNSEQPNFRSAYHRTGTLECMTVGPEMRTRSYKLSTGEELKPATLITPVSDQGLDEAAHRYGLDDSSILTTWERLDPVSYAEKILYSAKRILGRDKYHQRMMFIRDGQGKWHLEVLVARDRTEKHLLMRSVAQFVESKSCDAIVEVGEAWIAPAESVKRLKGADIQSAKERGEVLYVMVVTREGIFRTYTTPFSRGPLGGIKFADTYQSSDKFSLHYLQPILEVWQRQGRIRLPDGKELPRPWEPDALDTCFCGGPKRFGECCRPNLPLRPSTGTIRGEIEDALVAGKFGHAEKLARAELAQYVIWIKQHTAVIMHVADELYRQIVNIDILALQSHIELIERCLEAGGRGEMLIPQLRHLSEIIGVPKISMRLVALTARLLLHSGRTEEAILELDALGDVQKIEVTKLDDTMALLAMAQICDFSSERKEKTLRHAAAVAADKDEEWSAKRVLAEHLFRRGRTDEAMTILDSIILESSGPNPSDELYEALFLRWRLAKRGEDLQAFMDAVASGKNVFRRQYAAALIDEGLYLEAEELMLDEVEGDLVSKLLVVDARTRAGSVDSALTLFFTIDESQIQPELQYLYAVISAQLALASKDAKVRQLGVNAIKKLPSSLTKHRYVEDLFAQIRNLPEVE